MPTPADAAAPTDPASRRCRAHRREVGPRRSPWAIGMRGDDWMRERGDEIRFGGEGQSLRGPSTSRPLLVRSSDSEDGAVGDASRETVAVALSW